MESDNEASRGAEVELVNPFCLRGKRVVFREPFVQKTFDSDLEVPVHADIYERGKGDV